MSLEPTSDTYDELAKMLLFFANAAGAHPRDYQMIEQALEAHRTFLETQRAELAEALELIEQLTDEAQSCNLNDLDYLGEG